MKEQDLQPSLVFQGGSLASRIRLQESVKRLVMNVTYGRSSGESLASLDRSGLWLKMYGDSFQVNLDGSFEEYSEILPTWGTMLFGVLFQPPQAGRTARREMSMDKLSTNVFFDFRACFEEDEDVLDFVFENLSTSGWESSFQDMGGYGEPNEMFETTPQDKKDLLYNHLLEIIRERDELKQKQAANKTMEDSK